MALDPAAAAVPGPDGKPVSSSAAAGGLLSSLLTPVAPARPVASVTGGRSDGDVSTAAGAAAGSAGVSSAAFHDTTPADSSDSTSNSTKTSGTNSAKKPPSVIRAWLLAGAERWKKNGGANIKRLEVKKARAVADSAAARQMKQATNPAPRTPAASTTAASGGGKGPSKAPSNGPSASGRSGPAPVAPKLAPTSKGPAPLKPAPPAPPVKPSPSPRPAPAPRPKAEGAKTTATDPAPAPVRPKAPKGPVAPEKHGKTPTGGADRPSADKTPGKTSGKGAADSAKASGGTVPGTTSADSKGSTTAGSPGRPTLTPAKPTVTAPGAPSSAGKTGTRPVGGGTAPGTTGPSPKSSSGPEKGSADKTVPAPRTEKDSSSAAGGTSKGETAMSEKTDAAKASAAASAKDERGKDELKKPAAATGTPAVATDLTKRGPLFTREARETGFRDGTRAARTAAKARAYGHGVQDGWHAVMATADDEKTLLDRARALREEERKDPTVTTAPPKPAVPPKPSAPPTTAPTVPAPARPLTVTGVDATAVHLGPDASRPSMARGEVRNLKGFERRLTDHHGQVQTVAEATKGLAFHANQQADSVTRLVEQAKGVKGGEKLLATLARLQEAAQAQVVLAEETHKRAVRGADATSAVLANTITRYGAIYQAVVDSDETAPAMLSFYKG